jgi:hypothetical protein
MSNDRPLALLAILLILAGVFAVPVSAMIGLPMETRCISALC